MSEAVKESEGVSLKVCSSWPVVNCEKNIVNAISVNTSGVSVSGDTLDEAVSLETCVQLVNKASEPCVLSVEVLSPKEVHITALFVVSEARVLEAYGKHGEYVCTVQADFVDEWEGMAVYAAEVKLPTSSTECSLKFATLKSKDELWLYGISASVERLQEDSQSHINFRNVNKILKESSQPLSEKAESCKKFIQLYGSFLNSSKAQPKIPDPQVVLKMLEAECFNQCQPLENVSKCLSSVFPSFASVNRSFQGKKPKEVDPSAQHKSIGIETDLSNDREFSAENNFKDYIDKRFRETENHILEVVEQRLQEFEKRQNEKLDLIIDLLSKRTD